LVESSRASHPTRRRHRPHGRADDRIRTGRHLQLEWLLVPGAVPHADDGHVVARGDVCADVATDRRRFQSVQAPTERPVSMTDGERPRYMISVAAELVGMHPQTLRMYEQKGLVQPGRTAGNTRLYSDADVERLRLIQRLTTELGLNLAGVERVLH